MKNLIKINAPYSEKTIIKLRKVFGKECFCSIGQSSNSSKIDMDIWFKVKCK